MPDSARGRRARHPDHMSEHITPTPKRPSASSAPLRPHARRRLPAASAATSTSTRPFFRLGFVVLTLLGGAGILVYLAAVLVIPDEGKERLDRRARPSRSAATGPGRVVGLGLVGVALARPALPRDVLAGGRRRLGARPDRRARHPLGDDARARRAVAHAADRRCVVARRRSRSPPSSPRSSPRSRGSTSASATASATASTPRRRSRRCSRPTTSASATCGSTSRSSARRRRTTHVKAQVGIGELRVIVAAGPAGRRRRAREGRRRLRRSASTTTGRNATLARRAAASS